MPGEFIPLSAYPEAQEKFKEAQAVELGTPFFEGIVNGFKFVALRDDGSAPGVGGGCRATVSKQSDRLTFDYLPPGTDPSLPQTEQSCESGEVVFIEQTIPNPYGWISAGVQYNAKALVSQFSEARVKPVTVQGRPGVIVEPLIPEGNGYSLVAFEFGRGWAVVSAIEMPMSETLKVAEGASLRRLLASAVVIDFTRLGVKWRHWHDVHR